MPIKVEDFPLRVNDHVLLDKEYVFDNERSHVELVIPKGSGGMVRSCDGHGADIDFGHFRLRVLRHEAMNNMTLYRKAEAAS